MQHLIRLALFAWLLAASLAAAQTTFDIDLNSSRSGVIPTEEIDHIYVLNVPAGVTQLTIRVDAFGDDADMAVYYGHQEEELFYDISPDPSPTFTINNPRAGRYEIYVMNLLWQPLSYELHVTAGGGQVIPPSPGGASLTITTRSASPEQQLEVSFSGAPGYSQDWIGLYREDADDRSYLAWQYIEGLRSGSRMFTTPSEPGRYNFRLFENNGYTRLAVSDTFEVRAAAQPPTPPIASVVVPCERLANESPFAELAEGASLTVTCPAACGSSGRLWGTDIYTSDSQVCLAARHAGVIGEQGGTFTVTMLPGQSSYPASTRHGVTSASWGGWEKSFSVAGTQADTEILAGTWQHVANLHRATLTFSWAPGGWQGTRDGETLQDIQFDGTVLRFVRPLGAHTQRHVGRLSVSGGVARFSGTFTQDSTGAQEYTWTAERPY